MYAEVYFSFHALQFLISFYLLAKWNLLCTHLPPATDNDAQEFLIKNPTNKVSFFHFYF